MRRSVACRETQQNQHTWNISPSDVARILPSSTLRSPDTVKLTSNTKVRKSEVSGKKTLSTMLVIVTAARQRCGGHDSSDKYATATYMLPDSQDDLTLGSSSSGSAGIGRMIGRCSCCIRTWSGRIRLDRDRRGVCGQRVLRKLSAQRLYRRANVS